MDLPVFVMSLVFSLILMLCSFLGSRAGWGLLGFFGSGLAILCALVLASDGNLTVTGSTTLAAANGNFISDFNLVTWIPIMVGGGELVVTIRRIFKL